MMVVIVMVLKMTAVKMMKVTSIIGNDDDRDRKDALMQL